METLKSIYILGIPFYMALISCCIYFNHSYLKKWYEKNTGIDPLYSKEDYKTIIEGFIIFEIVIDVFINAIII